jgi:hypothetical protein
MAKYLILIYGDEQQWDAMTEAEREKLDCAHRDFRAAAGQRVLSGAELAAASTATTLRADASGRLVTTDGPFLESKEVLGGYYLVEAADLDEICALTAGLYEVHAGHSAVEIRPVMGAS